MHSHLDRGYVSEFTQFMNDYLQHHPEVVLDQRRGWHIWWNRLVDLGQLERAQQDSVPLPPYPYSE